MGSGIRVVATCLSKKAVIVFIGHLPNLSSWIFSPLISKEKTGSLSFSYSNSQQQFSFRISAS